MHPSALRRLSLVALLLVPLCARAMERVWTRPAGQFRTEATPLIADLDGDSAPEILSVNLGGQVLLWRSEGTPVGAGQDGMIAQLPEGRWTSAPVLLDTPNRRVVFVSVEGTVAALDESWTVVWQHALGAETTWSHGVPAVLRVDEKSLLVIGDASGKITALDGQGAVVWTTPLEAGPSRAMVQGYRDASGKSLLIASAGDTLFALDAQGAIQWKRSLGGEIISRPEVYARPEGDLILCGTRAGSLFALTPAGEAAWEAKVGGEIDTSITLLPRDDKAPLILCTGVWGNLHAIEPDGTHAWTHIFDTKNRAHPVVVDANGDGTIDVLVATYDQRLLVFNTEGLLIDEVRLSGLVNASPVLVPGEKAGESDVLIFSNVLLAHRFHPGLPVSPYGPAPAPESVTLQDGDSKTLGRIVNPQGALLRVNTTVKHASGEIDIYGMMTARSLFDLPMPAERNEKDEINTEVRTADGGKVCLTANLGHHAWPTVPERKPIEVRASAAYGDFDPARLDASVEGSDTLAREVGILGLYQGESGQGALEIANNQDVPVRVRVTVSIPSNTDKKSFIGRLELDEVVPVPTANGEFAADALKPLGSDGLLQIPAGRVAKVWLRVDAGEAAPGEYTGEIAVQSLTEKSPSNLPVRIVVSPLRMPDQFPLKLCTWDYIPNQWFPNHPEAVLDGMGEHGVNIFPRTTVPTATADASGKLTIDWAALDVELDRLKGRGDLLLQVADAPVTWAEGFPETKKRAVKLDYLRQLRDHLKDHGRDYGDYALYPVDEPGLDYGPRVPIYVEAAELFREADPKFRIYTDPVPGLSWRDFERIDPLVDVWCPNMRLVNGLLVDDPRIQRIMDSGKPVWSYECVSQVKSLSPLAYNRANAWRAWHFGLQGIGMWTFSTTQANHWLANADVNDEYALVYPGDLPVASVRWEALRDGLEDVAAMALLKERIDANRSKPAKSALLKEAEEALRIATVDVMEISAPAFMESRDFRAQGNRRIWHSRADEVLFRMHREKIARLTMELDE